MHLTMQGIIPTRVAKIGGSCLRDPTQLEHLNKICSFSKNQVIVVSAVSGLTDLLIKTARETNEGFNTSTSAIRKHLEPFINYVDPDIETKQKISSLFIELDSYFKEVASSGISFALLDSIQTFGERVTTELVSCFIKKKLLFNAHSLDIDSLGIVSDERYGDADILPESERNLRNSLNRKGISVVPGFIAKSKKNNFTTLGRNGSDYTAVFIGISLRIPIYLFKDVKGVYPANPKYVRAVDHIIEELDIKQALMLSRKGAKIVCDKAMKLLVENHHLNPKVVITSYSQPDSMGTILTPTQKSQSFVIGNQEIATISSSEREKVLSFLRDNDLHPLAVFTNSHKITIAVEKSKLHMCEMLLQKAGINYETSYQYSYLALFCGKQHHHKITALLRNGCISVSEVDATHELVEALISNQEFTSLQKNLYTLIMNAT